MSKTYLESLEDIIKDESLPMEKRDKAFIAKQHALGNYDYPPAEHIYGGFDPYDMGVGFDLGRAAFGALIVLSIIVMTAILWGKVLG